MVLVNGGELRWEIQKNSLGAKNPKSDSIDPNSAGLRFESLTYLRISKDLHWVIRLKIFPSISYLNSIEPQLFYTSNFTLFHLLWWPISIFLINIEFDLTYFQTSFCQNFSGGFQNPNPLKTLKKLVWNLYKSIIFGSFLKFCQSSQILILRHFPSLSYLLMQDLILLKTPSFLF